MSVFILLFLSGCNIFDTKITSQTSAPSKDLPGEYKGYKIPATPEGYILVNENTFPDTKKEEQEKIDRAKELIKLLESNDSSVRKPTPEESTTPRSSPRRTPQVSPQNNPAPTPTKTPTQQDIQPEVPQDPNWQTKSKYPQDSLPQQESTQEQYIPGQPTEDFTFIPTDVWVNMNSQNYPEE